MSALIKRRLLAPMLVVAACFALAGPIVATASASDSSIIGVVNHWSPIVHRDEQKIAKTEKALQEQPSGRTGRRRLDQRGVRSAWFVSQLKAQSASSRNGGQGP